jgi:hypothetical protein
MGKYLFMYKYKRKSNVTFKGKQRDNVKKVKFLYPLSAATCRNLNFKNSKGACVKKSAGGCE